MDGTNDRIVPLDQLEDFRVAEGDPDVRGWDVLTADGQRIGEVDDLLIDTAAMKVRYLDVDIDDELPEGADGRHILVPIGYARLDEDDDRIFVDTLQRTTLGSIPEYRHGGLTRDFEMSVRGYYDTDAAAAAPDRDFYAHDAYRDENFFGRRRSVDDSI